MKRTFLHTLGLVAAVFALASCSQIMPEYSDGYVEVRDEITTCLPVNVVLQEATLKGISYTTGEKLVERGFYFSKASIDVASAAGDSNVTVYKVDDLTDGPFTQLVEDLELGTKYYVVAFAKRSSGKVVTGEEKCFFPDYLELGEADLPTATAQSDTYKTATVEVSVSGFGTSALVGTDATLLKPCDLGIYVYKSSETIANARVLHLDEAQANAVRQNSKVSFDVAQLKGGTDYKVVPFITIGLYRDYDEDSPVVMGTKKGAEVSFTTLPTPPPAVSIEPAENVTTYSVTLKATVTSDSDDEAPQVGFYISKTEAGLADEANRVDVPINLSESYDFSKYLANLSSFTDYFVKAYIKANGQTAYSSVVTFKTLYLANPVVDVTRMNYAYRLENVTKSSAKVALRLTAGMDPSLSAYGLKWGTSAESLTNNVAGTGMDEQTGMFEITLDGLTPGTVYYLQPYATNGAGEIESAPVEYFVTASTTQEYLYDASISTSKEMYERMSQSLDICQELSYFELDPIEGATATYYLLDRNLGSRAPYLSSDMGTRISNLEPDEAKRQRVGAYYQWGIGVPSVTWQMAAGANLTKAPNNYSWKVPTAVTGITAWAVNPCPAGYDIPTMSQWTEIINAVKGDDELGTLQTLYPSLLIGPTAFINPTNGGRNTGSPYDCILWTKDVNLDTGAVEAMTSLPAGTTTAAGIRTVARGACAAIRCVRVVSK